MQNFRDVYAVLFHMRSNFSAFVLNAHRFLMVTQQAHLFGTQRWLLTSAMLDLSSSRIIMQNAGPADYGRMYLNARTFAVMVSYLVALIYSPPSFDG